LEDDPQQRQRRKQVAATGGGLQSLAREMSRQRRQQKQKQPSPSAKTIKSRREHYVQLFNEPTEEQLNPETATLNSRTFIGRPVEIPIRQQRNLKNNIRGNEKDIQYDMWGDVIPQVEIDDPWPTDTISFSYKLKATESKRECFPTKWPSSRRTPSKGFVKQHGAFAYVSNVPCPIVIDGESRKRWGKFENVMHRQEVAETVANALNVPVTSVVPATMTSVFVGFENGENAADTILKNERKMIWRN